MKNREVIIGLICAICVICGICGSLPADNWSQTTFTGGTFSNAEPAAGATGVKLKLNINVGNGADGPVTVNAVKNINTDTIAVGRTVADGWCTRITALTANTATISDTPPANTFIAGDEVILINLKGISTAYPNVGKYEFLRIQSIAGNVIAFTPNKTNWYGDGAGADTNVGTNQVVMLQRVPNYTDVTITAASLTCNSFDGTKGGILAFRASGTVTVNVADGISVSTKGFRGGAGSGYGGSNSGESYNGTGGNGGNGQWTPGVGGTAQGGGGGGGDYYDYAGGVNYPKAGGGIGTGCGGGGGGCAYVTSGLPNPQGGGGGGGGYGSAGFGAQGNVAGADGSGSNGGAGGAGGVSGTSPLGGGGGGGGTDGQADSSGLNTRAYMGGGGGAGAGTWQKSYSSGAGGNGGGVVFIAATNINIAAGASITSNGGNAGNPTGGLAGGSGGGAGGSIVIFAVQITNSGSILANGGTKSVGNYSGGNGGGGRTYAQYNLLTGSAPSPNYSGSLIPYLTFGSYVSPLPNPAGLTTWGVLTYTQTTPANTTFSVDVLKAIDGSVLVSNVTSGTNLSTTVPLYTPIKLRANFSTIDTSQTPTLSNWGINYVGGSTTITTTNWTSLIAPGQKVAMGNSIAQAKFDMQTTSGTAHWKRFRVDKYARAGQALIPDSNIEVQLWMEANGDGFFDQFGDQMLAKGTFTNNTCYLNMNRWAVTTAPKTYYIVYKFDANCGGGQYAGVNIGDSSWLEFEECTAVGVPP